MNELQTTVKVTLFIVLLSKGYRPSERTLVTARLTFRGWMQRSSEVTTARAPKSQLILFAVPVEYAQRPRRTDSVPSFGTATRS